ncbi:MAG TPA: hypothetical protein VHB79_19385 [Polyangiaceae bacterium]|nr:hypothetical protein [Polyangiaceae bacterium]
MTTTLKAPELRPLPWRRATSSIFAMLGLLLMPKCPLCVAAYLVSLGVGVEAAHSAAPFVRPLAWLLVLAALAALGLGLWRARSRTRSAAAACCCEPRVRGAG